MKTKLSQTKQDEITSKLLSWQTQAEEGNAAMFKRMSACERYKVGRQWSVEDLDWNNSNRKHSITINRILPAVLQIDGHEAQNPRDINVKPTKTTTQTRARLLMGIIKHIMDASNGGRKKSNAFDDGLTTGRGYLIPYRSYDRDPKGDWCIGHHDPFQVLPDPNRTAYDPNDLIGGARYFITQEWVPKDYIERLYPKHKEQLGSASYGSDGGQRGGMWNRFVGLVHYMFKDSVMPWDVRASYRDEDSSDSPETRRRWEDSYCRRTFWWRTWEEGCYVQRLDQPDWYVTLHRKGDIEYAKDRLKETRKRNIRIIESTNGKDPVVVPVLHWATMVGDVLLDYELDPFNGVNRFPVIPFSPYYYHGYEFGLVDNLIGPQQVVNSSWSRVLDLLKSLANTGWKVGKANDQMLRWLELHGSQDGIVLDESKFGGKIEKIEGNPYPVGFAELTDRSTQHISEIANVRVEEQNWDKADLSGRAIALKQQATMTGSAMIFSNYDWTVEMLGHFLIDCVIRSGTTDQAEIESLIDEEELIDARLLDESRSLLMQQMYGQIIPAPEPPDPVMVEQLDPQSRARWWIAYKEEERLYSQIMQEIDALARPMAKAALLDEFDNLPQGRYGVKVGLSESASTHRAQNFIELMELHKTLLESQLPGVPRKVLVEASDVSHKDEILAAAG